MKLQNALVADAIEEYNKTPEFTIKIRSEKTQKQYLYQLQRLCETLIDKQQVKSIPIAELSVALALEGVTLLLIEKVKVVAEPSTNAGTSIPPTIVKCSKSVVPV